MGNEQDDEQYEQDKQDEGRLNLKAVSTAFERNPTSGSVCTDVVENQDEQGDDEQDEQCLLSFATISMIAKCEQRVYRKSELSLVCWSAGLVVC